MWQIKQVCLRIPAEFTCGDKDMLALIPRLLNFDEWSIPKLVFARRSCRLLKWHSIEEFSLALPSASVKKETTQPLLICTADVYFLKNIPLWGNKRLDRNGIYRRGRIHQILKVTGFHVVVCNEIQFEILMPPTKALSPFLWEPLN